MCLDEVAHWIISGGGIREGFTGEVAFELCVDV